MYAAIQLSIIEDNAQRNELEELYKENLNRFLNIAYSNLHNKSDAEDAVQETFRRIAEKPEKFFAVPLQYRIKYVFIIIKNVSVEMFGKKNKVSFEEFNEEISYDENQPSLEDDIIGKISRDKLKSFIKTLPPLQRDVLTLRCVIGLSTANTAEALNISQSSVKERLRLARKAVLKFVHEEGGYYE